MVLDGLIEQWSSVATTQTSCRVQWQDTSPYVWTALCREIARTAFNNHEERRKKYLETPAAAEEIPLEARAELPYKQPTQKRKQPNLTSCPVSSNENKATQATSFQQHSISKMSARPAKSKALQ